MYISEHIALILYFSLFFFFCTSCQWRTESEKMRKKWSYFIHCQLEIFTREIAITVYISFTRSNFPYQLRKCEFVHVDGGNSEHFLRSWQSWHLAVYRWPYSFVMVLPFNHAYILHALFVCLFYTMIYMTWYINVKHFYYKDIIDLIMKIKRINSQHYQRNNTCVEMANLHTKAKRSILIFDNEDWKN